MALVPLFRHLYDEPITRLRVPPADAGGVPATPRPHSPDGQRSRRPHSDARIAQVRRLIETTTLTYSQIAAQAGVGRASISRWSRDFSWTRPLNAPRATDRAPSSRAGQKRKLRTLAERLRHLAERHVDELENAPRIDPGRLMAALQLLKMARLAAQGRRRRRKPLDAPARTGQQMMDEETAIKAAIRELYRGGVNVDAAPQEAVEMVIDAHLPPMGAQFRTQGKPKRY